MPTRAPIRVWRGNNAPPIVWSFPETFDLTGSSFVLTIAVGDAVVLTAKSADGDITIDTETGYVSWPYSLADSRLIPIGRDAQYELERRVGSEQRTMAYGVCEGIGGINSDV